jgi:archaeal type IV pilus assembly protein PilA
MRFCVPTYQQTKGGKTNKMNKFRSISKNAKALSPVVASIILIAVTVAVSVVVAAWMGGMSIGMMGQAEQGSITNVYFTGASNNQIVVTISNTGQSTMNFTSAYVSGVVVTSNPAFTGPGVNGGVLKGGSNSYTLTGVTWVSGTTYDIKFTTTKANNLVSTIVAP